MIRWFPRLAGASVLVGPLCTLANPSAFADGTTVMAEYGAQPQPASQTATTAIKTVAKGSDSSTPTAEQGESYFDRAV